MGEILLIRSRRTPYAFCPDQRELVGRLRARGCGPTWLCDPGPKAVRLLERAWPRLGVEPGLAAGRGP
ncbi:MAG: hypothetical protein EHM60_13070, partial [Lysobacterales bacterium]